MSKEEDIMKHIESLNSSDFEVRKNAIWVLGESGKMAKKAVPALVKLLNDKRDELCYLATFALEKIGKDSKDVFPELIGALNDENIRISNGTMRILRKIGRDPKIAKDMAIVLIQALNNQRSDDNWNYSYITILERLRVKDPQLRNTINNLLIKFD